MSRYTKILIGITLTLLLGVVVWKILGVDSVSAQAGFGGAGGVPPAAPVGGAPVGGAGGAVSSAPRTGSGALDPFAMILGPETGISGFTIDTFTRVAGFFLIIINFLTWILFSFLDVIMDPQWMFDLRPDGTDGPLLMMLHEIWQLCRDLVNVFLALVLVYHAIRMIVTADSGKLKETMPKFVVALVLVNFSWFIPRAIFDASQVLAYTAYQIPSLLGADGCTTPSKNPNVAARQPCEIVTRIAIFEEATKTVTPTGLNTIDNTRGWSCPIPGLICYQSLPINAPGADPQPRSKILNGLILNHARLSTLSSLVDPRAMSGVGPVPGETSLQKFNRVMGFLAKLIVVLVLNIALFFPMLAMAAAFFIRIPVLWVTMALMPIVAVGYTVGADKLKDFNPMETILNQFLSAVFLPVKVAVPFAIGFIMINAGAQTPASEVFSRFAPISLMAGIRDFWQFTWMLIALFVVWKYSFKALSGDETIGAFTERIKGFGTSLGQIAYRLPLSLPIIPVGAGKGASILQATRGLGPAGIAESLRFGNLEDTKARIAGNLGLGTGATNGPPGSPQIRRKISGIARAPEVQPKMQPYIDALKTNKGLTTKDATELGNGDKAMKLLLRSIREAQPTETSNVEDRDIIAGVIDAINPGSDLKAILEGYVERMEGGGSGKKIHP